MQNEPNNTIQELFKKRNTVKEIQVYLRKQQIFLSDQTIYRKLWKMKLYKKKSSNIPVLRTLVAYEINNGSENKGYRSMARHIEKKYGEHAPCNTVKEIMKTVDPVGVNLRKHRVFKRRMYHNSGPNFLLHIDGFDKLKPYGFAVHGAICGFSRKVLWCKVSSTNNNPRVVGSYFLQFCRDIKGAPKCVRFDRGTENTQIKEFMKAFYHHEIENDPNFSCVLVGSSPQNQRIEGWWSQLQKLLGRGWKRKFEELVATGVYDCTNQYQRNVMRYCCMELLQKELDMLVQEWNEHRIRKQKADEVRTPTGFKPNFLYDNPEVVGCTDYKTQIDLTQLPSLEALCLEVRKSGVDLNIEQQLDRRRIVAGIHRKPETIDEALSLYRTIK